MQDILGLQLGLTNALRSGHVWLDVVICMLIPIIIGWVHRSQERWMRTFLTRCMQRIPAKSYNQITVSKHVFIRQSTLYHMPSELCSAALYETIFQHVGDDIRQNGPCQVKEVIPNWEIVTETDGKLMNFTFRPPHDVWIQNVSELEGMELRFRYNEIGGNIDQGTRGNHFLDIRSMELSTQDMLIRVKCLHKKRLDSISHRTENVLYVSRIRKWSRNTVCVTAQERQDCKSFDTVFFPHKTELITRLNAFQSNPKETQLGILLSGPPGTGKTSAVMAIAKHLKRHIVNLDLSAMKHNDDFFDIMHNVNYDMLNHGTCSVWKPNKVVFVMEDVDAGCAAVLKRDKFTVTSCSTSDMWSVLAKLGFRTPFEYHDSLDIFSCVEQTMDTNLDECFPLLSKKLRSLNDVIHESVISYMAGHIRDRDLIGKRNQVYLASGLSEENFNFTWEKMFAPQGDHISFYIFILFGLLFSILDVMATSYKCGQNVHSNIVMLLLGSIPNILQLESLISKYVTLNHEDMGLMFNTVAFVNDHLSSPHASCVVESSSSTQKLTLDGILNVLDGSMPVKDRVFITTTNRENILDPALLRPGRVDVALKMHHLDLKSAIDMIRYWFDCEISEKDLMAHLEPLFARRRITGAELEQACRSQSNVENAVKSLLTNNK